MEMAPGTILRDAYRIESIVARGRYSVVYRAFDLKRPRVLALKQVRTAEADDRLVPQFQAEFQALAELEHPNQPKVWDYITEAGEHFFVMDFVQATPLSTVLEVWGGPPGWPVLLNWLSQLVDVLEYLHDRKVIFRDLRPANVMAMANGYLKLIDFGIAKILMSPEERTRFRDVGAAEYAPLEHFVQGPSTPQSDIYSLGATMYYLATGSPPPLAPKRLRGAETLAAIAPAELESAIHSMMALRPEERPSSMAEVRDRLSPVLQDVPRTPVPIPVQALIRAEKEARSG